MAEHLKLAKSDTAPETPPAFVMTNTAREIFRSLGTMQKMTGFRIAIICGAAGIGKTHALDAYLANDPQSFKLDAAGGEAKPEALAEDLCARLGVHGWENMSLTSRRRALVRVLAYMPVLVLDEAQNYSVVTLEWVRRVCEEAQCNLVIAGGAELYTTALCNPQIESRAVLPRLFASVAPADVNAIAKAHGLDRDGITRELELVACHGGGLRKMRNVIELSTIFANGATVTIDHVRSAKAELGFNRSNLK